MRHLKHFLFISLVLLQVFTTFSHAEDDTVIPESDTSPGTFVPPSQGMPTPPMIIDDSDANGASLDYNNDDD